MSRTRFHWLAFALFGALISVAGANDKPGTNSAAGKEATEKSTDGKPAAGKDADGDATKGAALDQDELEKKFAEDMAGVVFSGNYSVTKDGKETPAAMEKYTIASVSKVKDDVWRFTARIQYGKHDVTVPMDLQVKWAGDTPMISLTNLTIPLLGTFTSRVLIYGDRYAGTWQHGKTGGHLWGRIDKIKKADEADEARSKSDKS